MVPLYAGMSWVRYRHESDSKEKKKVSVGRQVL